MINSLKKIADFDDLKELEFVGGAIRIILIVR